MLGDISRVDHMKKPYVKEIDPGLHSLQAEVGGDIATAYPFSDPVGLVCNDEGKLIGLELNRGLRDEHGRPLRHHGRHLPGGGAE